MDFHTANVFRLVKKASDAFVKLDAANIPKPVVPKDAALATGYYGLAGGITYPKTDEDLPSRAWYIGFYLSLNNNWVPMGDAPETWESLKDATAGLRATFGNYLPPSDTDWLEPHTDEALWRWVTQGFISQRLERVPEGQGNPDDAGGFVVRLEEMMGDLDVRPPFKRYGGDAWFSASGKPTRIVWDGTEYKPSDAGWEAAKFAFRSSGFVWATLSDHVGRAHLACANGFVLPMRRHLSPEHPLRQFCKPFCYRSAAINIGASQTLLPDGALLHRATGFTKDSLHKAFDRAFADVAFVSFAEELRGRGVHPDDLPPDLSPYGTDGLAYWNCVEAFVDDAFDNSDALKEILGTHRDETEDWWTGAMANCRADFGEISEAAIREYVKVSIFNVSGFHSHVGTVGAYVRDPRFLCTKLWPDGVMCDKQTSATLCVIACITGFPMATIDGDLSQHMPDAGASAAAVSFREALTVLEGEIDARNEKRALPYRLFLPSRIATSVAI